MNSRLDEIHAAILTARLPWLEKFGERRRAIARAYRSGIREGRLRLLAAPLEEANHVYHLFVLRCDERDALSAHLKGKGVEAQIHYPIPVHKQVPCREIARDPQGLVHAEAHARDCISIPIHPQMSDGDVNAVIAALNSF
jgi:dTDP-4-amino-4,6-dideoxygalactose transaminase